MQKRINKVLFGISFDGVVMSGITEEFKKLSFLFFQEGYNILFDLGYDITSQKKNFFKPYTREQSLYPDYIKLIRIPGLDNVNGYTQDFVDQIKQVILGAKEYEPNNPLREKMNKISNEISLRIHNCFLENNISFLVVENGTLPNNIVFTDALYHAIERYGKYNKLSKYVLWMDYDFMWNCKTINSGRYPYPDVPKLRKSKYIQYAAPHDYSIKKAKKWCGEVDIKPMPVSYSIPDVNDFSDLPICIDRKIRKDFRNHYRIPEDSMLICKTARIVPAKKTEREIELIKELNMLLSQRKSSKRAYLGITGNQKEYIHVYQALKSKIKEYKLEKFVFFTGLLRSFSDSRRGLIKGEGYSVRDLVAASDFSSFMTSYNYESFGIPILEASIVGTPYICTSYKYYTIVYGLQGFEGLIFPITNKNDNVIFPDAKFAQAVLKQYQESSDIKNERRKNNYMAAYKYYSMDTFKKNLKKMFPIIFKNE